ncbi:MAG: glucose-1-phosphate cytidylyltransferase [Nitrospirae bacterium]|nr:glucose-1-phosphate cytidylyltransferase [Nitrospirota bacterium]
MRVVILCGGLGTRLSEETSVRPKPMVEIGGKPILWHIMKIYSHYGFNDFILCLGYKGYIIKEYFANYYLHQSDVTFDIANQSMKIHQNNSEPWKVTLVDTGDSTMTGGRLKRISKYIEKQPFMLTYGDGLGNIDIKALVTYHKQHGKLATVTSTQPSGRFGAMNLDEENRVRSFQEKPAGDGAWINGGFFVMEPKCLDYLIDDQTILERDPLEKLAKENQLIAYKHTEFWQPMDTLRDKLHLEELWQSGKAPWKVWA